MYLGLLFTSFFQAFATDAYEIAVYLLYLVSVYALALRIWTFDVDIDDPTALPAKQVMMRRRDDIVSHFRTRDRYGPD